MNTITDFITEQNAPLLRVLWSFLGSLLVVFLFCRWKMRQVDRRNARRECIRRNEEDLAHARRVRWLQDNPRPRA